MRTGWRYSRDAYSPSKPKPIVFLVSSDPEPGDRVSLPHPYRPVMIPNPHHAYPIPPFLEFKRRVIRFSFPERILLPGKLLHACRQRIKALPKAPMRLADHGSSSTRPARRSPRTSSKTLRNLPSSAKSASIWLSHAASSRFRMNDANSVSSASESSSTALLISAKLMVASYASAGSKATAFAPSGVG